MQWACLRPKVDQSGALAASLDRAPFASRTKDATEADSCQRRQIMLSPCPPPWLCLARVKFGTCPNAGRWRHAHVPLVEKSCVHDLDPEFFPWPNKGSGKNPGKIILVGGLEHSGPCFDKNKTGICSPIGAK